MNNVARHRQSRASSLAMRAGAAGSVLSILAVAGAAGASNDKGSKQVVTSTDMVFFWIIIGVVAASIVGFAIPWLVTRRTYMKNQNEHFAVRIKAERERHQQALEQLKKTTELATLMELNQDQIKTYHDIVTEQADKSFKSSRTAMHVGLLLLVAAAIGGVKVPVEQVRWFIGALALFSTTFSAYLSRTYLLLYRESISQLNRYFDQPVLNSYYLTAERLTGGLTVEHAQTVRQQIIDQVLENSTHTGDRSQKQPKTAQQEEKKPKLPKQKTTKPKKPKKQSASLNGTPQA
ncbi:hypothetical protein [Streptomyces sp. AK02-04a]|uniref:hypothetical protein n=1 Tax=Streptomyces sp. AK02-04a TaxID=3028649 RepID=UPI0029B2D903|nr:hypothetical protein [Streptomyces sp. AK02-04a]MDX3756260.1 hypothetical protein [Streptomyces sp. AK02-04a]